MEVGDFFYQLVAALSLLVFSCRCLRCHYVDPVSLFFNPVFGFGFGCTGLDPLIVVGFRSFSPLDLGLFLCADPVVSGVMLGGRDLLRADLISFAFSGVMFFGLGVPSMFWCLAVVFLLIMLQIWTFDV